MNIDHIEAITGKSKLEAQDLRYLLTLSGDDMKRLFEISSSVKSEYVGNKVYFRGLIEYSNSCVKNCFYCGIRTGMKQLHRYKLTDDEVLEAAKFALQKRYGSIVIQGGERSDNGHVANITRLLQRINRETNNQLHITLSLGEQSEETYRIWKENGAQRYLLRIETSNEDLYKKLHPDDDLHSFSRRIKALEDLKKLGYQVGSGVMIGLPFQTIDDLAQDLLFFKAIDIDMNGMGPYIEHEGTPLYNYRHLLMSKEERLALSLKMIAVLRILMKDINIAATTAMQTLAPDGREQALAVGANVIMPNITPVKYRENYQLYDNKPCINEEAEQCVSCLENRIKSIGNEIGYDEWGDSRHYLKKKF
ncbi:MAG TPA: [FeFe] hydrogenase H-cluster radical SAM maturase HydE [Bacteroidales bacterium]|nr:[FeFe] hydrogenase H-cluster radical SAM maturase HydE [Bacteroidales bacterium]HRR48520.1 [FeFe] hydrogenase H-cluster radical SAM maturase HydE [Bacteroidales bacterium]HRT33015.1 [FeFe] hydrogenase H-cluster radical SAM maturase HydE [Bacteroidales bacterium]HRT83015.1 [FeFe] hydrogenase H-cluster radical SAM maturase HydE [Bacteroidales bacterium]